MIKITEYTMQEYELMGFDLKYQNDRINKQRDMVFEMTWYGLLMGGIVGAMGVLFDHVVVGILGIVIVIASYILDHQVGKITKKKKDEIMKELYYRSLRYHRKR